MSELIINSKENKKIKHLQKLISDKKYRWENQQFVIEGYKIFQFAQGCQEIFVQAEKTVPEVKAKIPINKVSEKIFKTISDTEHAQGVVGVCSFKIMDKLNPDKNYIYLDGVQDPGNLGTIIRTAAAFDYGGIILGENCVDPYLPKVVRATMGAIFQLEIVQLPGDEPGKHILLAADQHGQSIAKLEGLTKPFILALGSEGQGLNPRLKARADQTIAIPVSAKVESLNVAMAAGILMYELKARSCK